MNIDALGNYFSFDIITKIYAMKCGYYSEYFNGLDGTTSILNNSRDVNDKIQPIPLLFPLDEITFISLREGTHSIFYKSDFIADIDVYEKFTCDKRNLIHGIFKTLDKSHPGVNRWIDLPCYFIGGKIVKYGEIEKYFKYPQRHANSIKSMFKNKKWRDVCGFQTRNFPHRGHEAIHRIVLNLCDGILLNPVLGIKKTGDFSDEILISSYETYVKNYLNSEHAIIEPLNYNMMYAGPREALHLMLMREKMGCSHYVLGRDPCGIGSFYDRYEAWQYVNENLPDRIKPLFIEEIFYCKKCELFCTDRECGHSDQFREKISGTSLRNIIFSDMKNDLMLIRPEVLQTIRNYIISTLQEK
ncbi:sulfate adenylyltransferase [Caldiplasma sukawensis]